MPTEPAFVVPPPITEEIRTLLSGVKKLAPVVGRIRLPGGAIIALAALAEMTDTLAQAQIKRHIQKKTKRKTKDNQQVVKVKDAIDCVEKVILDPETLLFVAKDIASAIVDPGFGQMNQLPIDPIATCIRSKALQQKNAKRHGTFKRSKKPYPHVELYSERMQIRKGKLHPHLP